MRVVRRFWVRPTVSPALILALALLLSVPVLVLGQAPAADSIAPFLGHWEGEIELPGAPLAIQVDFRADRQAGAESPDAEYLAGAIDIPAQGATGLRLADISVEDGRLRFSIAGVPGAPTFNGALVEDQIRGNFEQGGASFPFYLGRDEVAALRRPQEPVAPLPYDSEELSYQNGDVTLAGTLTLPRGEGPFPAALLITGSGAQNRDEELLGHKPFLVLSDHLTRGGIAVLRVDDRGVGGSTGSVAQSTSEDFAADVLAGIAQLRGHARIRADAVGVIGHSEGGLVGPLAASRSRDIAFVILLAGPGVSGREILPLQMRRMASVGGVGGIDAGELDRQIRAQEKLLELVAEGATDDALRSALAALVELQIEAQPVSQRPAGEQLKQLIETAFVSTTSPWFRFFVTYDPAPALRQLKVPVLALNGELDLQVDAAQNLPAIASALGDSESADWTVRKLPGLNHLFQSATTGAFAEYAQIEETISPRVLDLIVDWVRERFVP